MRLAGVGIWLVLSTGVVGGTPCGAAAQDAAYGVFLFQDSVTVPGTAERAFDAFVDVNAWWDHRFSQTSVRFFIEPKVGGGFWELFDDEGNGVRHATVIYVHRPTVLRMEGPLGMSGNALLTVFTLAFNALGDSTVVTLEAHGAGELRSGWAEAIQRTWHHFLAERYKPYLEGRLE